MRSPANLFYKTFGENYGNQRYQDHRQPWQNCWPCLHPALPERRNLHRLQDPFQQGLHPRTHGGRNY